MSIVYSVAAIAGLFVVWKQAKNRLFPETVVFDTFFIAVVVGLISARIVAITLDFQRFHFSVLAWFLPHVYPGMYLPAGILGSIGFVWYVLRKKSDPSFWDFLVILVRAFWITAILVYSGLIGWGEEIGRQTGMPWGIAIDNFEGNRHPVAVYTLLLLVFCYIFFHRITKMCSISLRYESGALIGIFSGIMFFVGVFTEHRVLFGKLTPDQWGYLVIIMLSIILIVQGSRLPVVRTIERVAERLKSLQHYGRAPKKAHRGDQN